MVELYWNFLNDIGYDKEPCKSCQSSRIISIQECNADERILEYYL
jgi:hypothetical protein